MSVPDVPLDNINAEIDADVEAAVGLNLAGGIGLNANLTGSGTLNANLGGSTALDLGLDELRIKELPALQLRASIEDLPLVRTDSKVDLGLNDVRIREFPLQLQLALKPVRVHLPLNYSFCLQLFGRRVFTFSIQGEGMVITEDYLSRKSESCKG